MVRDQHQAMAYIVIQEKSYPHRPNMLLTYSSLARSDQWFGNKVILPVTASLNFGHVPFIGTYLFQKSVPIPKKMTCEPNPSAVSFLLRRAVMKTTVLESRCALSYFRLDALGMRGRFSCFAAKFCRYMATPVVYQIYRNRKCLVLWGKSSAVCTACVHNSYLQFTYRQSNICVNHVRLEGGNLGICVWGLENHTFN